MPRSRPSRSALRAKGETPGELAALVRTMLQFAERVDLSDVDAPLVDTCGTGGDGAGTVNVSTMAAVVTAAAGAKVAKHGGRAASSKCGSVDVLETLGVVIDLGPDGVARCVREVGHRVLLRAALPRGDALRGAGARQLGTPTTFNFLGPLANPAGATRRTVGVSDPVMAERVVRTLGALGVERALVFFGHDGLDELTVTTTSTVYELERRRGRASTTSTRSTSASPTPSWARSRAATPPATRRPSTSVFAGAHGPIRDIVTLERRRGHDGGRRRARSRRRGRARSRRARRRTRPPPPSRRSCAVSVAAREAGTADGPRARVPGMRAPPPARRPIPASDTFRCEQCGQVLKAPTPVSSQPGAPPPPARGSAHRRHRRAGSDGAASPHDHHSRRRRRPRDAPVRTAAAVSATVAATAPVDDADGSGGGRRVEVRAVSRRPHRRRRSAQGPLVLAGAGVDRGGAARVPA